MKPVDTGITGRSAALVIAALGAVVLLVYANSFHVPFLLDDEVTILANPSIRHLWDLAAVFQPPVHVFSAGRPLLNLSFALNYAVSGTDVAGYHAVNVLIHLLAGLVLFGLVRRVLSLPSISPQTLASSTGIAAFVTALWLLHPLQTAAVTYVSQRAESLMALFYLLTLYGFVCARTAESSRWWAVGSVLAFLLGVLTKETIATEPLLVLAVERVYFSESLRGAIRRQAGLFAGYAVGWIILLWFVAAQSLASRGIGFSHGVSSVTYGLAEARAFTRYLTLAAWPQPLVFDYGVEFFNGPTWATVGAGAVVLIAVVVSIAAWRRSTAVGIGGLAFFLILAPTTSIVPIALQPMAENRIYLPLAVLVILSATGINAVIGGRRAAVAGVATMLAFGALVVARNHDFRSAESIWTDTVAKRGGSSRAHNNLGLALLSTPNRRAEAVACFETAVRLNANFPEAHNNLGIALADTPGRQNEALDHYTAAIRAKPAFAQAHANLANLLLRTPGRMGEGLEHYRTALSLQPANALLHANYAAALADEAGKRADALSHFTTALQLDAQMPSAHAGLARLLAQDSSRRAGALTHYEAALRLNPADAEARFNFANLLATDDAMLPRAIENYEAALRSNPDLAPGYNNLAIALYRADRLAEAIAWLETAQKRGVASEAMLKNLAQLRARQAR